MPEDKQEQVENDDEQDYSDEPDWTDEEIASIVITDKGREWFASQQEDQ